MTEAAHGRLRRRLRRRADRHLGENHWRRFVSDGDAGGAAPSSGREEAAALPTNLGPAFDARVERALRSQPPPGVDADYDVVRENFDVAHYLLQAPGVMDNPEIDPVRHFLRQGAAAKQTPQPNFSTDSYLKRYPERRTATQHPYAAWLDEGRAAGEIAEPVMGIEKLAQVLGVTPAAVADALAERRSDVHRRMMHGRLGEMFAKAAEVEPLIGELWPETARPRMMPIPWLVVADQLGALHASQEALEFRRCRIVLVLDDLAEPLATQLLAGLIQRVPAHDVAVVTTNQMPSPDRPPLPTGIRHVDFALTARGLGPLMTQQVLVELLRSVCAQAIVAVGSSIFLDSLAPYGRALAATERIFLGFPALRPHPFGHSVGTSARYFYRHAELATGIITDTPATAARLIEDYQVPDHLVEAVRWTCDPPALAGVIDAMLEEVHGDNP